MHGKNNFKSTYATGHSLGGNLAQYVMIVFGMYRCVTFNAEGFNKAFRNLYRREIEDSKGQIINWHSDWDILKAQGKAGLKNLGEQGEAGRGGHGISGVVSYYNKNGYYEKTSTGQTNAPNAPKKPDEPYIPTIFVAHEAIRAINKGGSTLIKVDRYVILRLLKSFREQIERLIEHREMLERHMTGTPSVILSMDSIELDFNSALRKIKRQADQLTRISITLQRVIDEFDSVDKEIANEAKKVNYLANRIMNVPSNILSSATPRLEMVDTAAFADKSKNLFSAAPVPAGVGTVVSQVIGVTLNGLK